MNLIFAPKYKKENTKYLAVHHVGTSAAAPTASMQSITSQQVNDLHKTRFDFKSALGYYGGYNFFIEADGKVTQFRQIGEDTAAQLGYNFDGLVISVCLAGNFSLGSPDRPTANQIMRLQELREDIENAGIKIAEENIVPHRHFADTECFGMALSEDWARIASRKNVVVETKTDANTVIMLHQKLSLLQQLRDLYLKLIDLTRAAGFKGLPPQQIYLERGDFFTKHFKCNG